MEKGLAISRAVAVLMIPLLMTGCSALRPLPPETMLGINVRADEPERLISAASLTSTRRIGADDSVYEIRVPLERMNDLGCRTFETLDEKTARICRVSSRVLVDGRRESAFVNENHWAIFVPRGAEVSQFIFTSPDGNEKTVVSARDARKLSEEEAEAVFSKLVVALPRESNPFPNVWMRFGDATLLANRVSGVSREEALWGCGVLSVSTSMLAVATPVGAAMEAISFGMKGLCVRDRIKNPDVLMRPRSKNSSSKTARTTLAGE